MTSDQITSTASRITPPFTRETARAKVKAAEKAWNSRDPEIVAQAYTEDSDWRNRTEFFKGREAIKAFLKRKWGKELDYRLMKELWCFTGNRTSMRFEYEGHDSDGQWYRTHGNEHWEFDDDGLIRRRQAARKPRYNPLSVLSDSLRSHVPRQRNHPAIGLHVDGVGCARRILVSG